MLHRFCIGITLVLSVLSVLMMVHAQVAAKVDKATKSRTTTMIKDSTTASQPPCTPDVESDPIRPILHLMAELCAMVKNHGWLFAADSTWSDSDLSALIQQFIQEHCPGTKTEDTQENVSTTTCTFESLDQLKIALTFVEWGNGWYVLIFVRPTDIEFPSITDTMVNICKNVSICSIIQPQTTKMPYSINCIGSTQEYASSGSTNEKTTEQNHGTTMAEALRSTEDQYLQGFIISSVCSFVAGVICALLAVFIYSVTSTRKTRDSTKNTSIQQESVVFRSEAKVDTDCKQQDNQNTSSGSEGLGTNQLRTEKVFIGLATEPKFSGLSDSCTRTVGKIVNKIKSSNSQIYEPTIADKEDHVYQVINSKNENASNDYEATNSRVLIDHIYTGLHGREGTKQCTNTEATAGEADSESNNRTCDDHSYIILENEGNDVKICRTLEKQQGQTELRTELGENGQMGDYHDYLILREEKFETDHQQGRELENTDGLNNDVYSHTHDYHVLERI